MTNPLAPSSLLTPLLSSAAMREILDDRARLQRMLDFIVALARAEAAVGVIPALATDQIAAAGQDLPSGAELTEQSHRLRDGGWFVQVKAFHSAPPSG